MKDLALLLEAAHLSQANLASRLGVSRAAVSQWVKGTKRPRPHMEAAILRALKHGDSPPMTPPEIARHYGVNEKTVRDHLWRGILRGRKDEKGRWRVERDESERWLKEGYNAQAGPRDRSACAPRWRQNIPHDYAVRLRTYRVRREISQTMLATELGMADKNAISRWEIGRNMPSLDVWRLFEQFEAALAADKKI
jgi:transcriptional regulator with XRE-family HTH domain